MASTWTQFPNYSWVLALQLDRSHEVKTILIHIDHWAFRIVLTIVRDFLLSKLRLRWATLSPFADRWPTFFLKGDNRSLDFWVNYLFLDEVSFSGWKHGAYLFFFRKLHAQLAILVLIEGVMLEFQVISVSNFSYCFFYEFIFLTLSFDLVGPLLSLVFSQFNRWCFWWSDYASLGFCFIKINDDTLELPKYRLSFDWNSFDWFRWRIYRAFRQLFCFLSGSLLFFYPELIRSALQFLFFRIVCIVFGYRLFKTVKASPSLSDWGYGFGLVFDILHRLLHGVGGLLRLFVAWGSEIV